MACSEKIILVAFSGMKDRNIGSVFGDYRDLFLKESDSSAYLPGECCGLSRFRIQKLSGDSTGSVVKVNVL